MIASLALRPRTKKRCSPVLRKHTQGALGVRTDAETGLVYMRARHYDKQLQRFVSQDPMMSLNRYAYCSNRPNSFVDPQGLAAQVAPVFLPAVTAETVGVGLTLEAVGSGLLIAGAGLAAWWILIWLLAQADAASESGGGSVPVPQPGPSPSETPDGDCNRYECTAKCDCEQIYYIGTGKKRKTRQVKMIGKGDPNAATATGVGPDQGTAGSNAVGNAKIQCLKFGLTEGVGWIPAHGSGHCKVIECHKL